ncbi:hypothetical protein BJ165DRAFT_1426572 [Panaeolus papilionaceus]|nr:hypothetical protein BJ165DRAFT_1426572 [Panaeolus papilionaceus]
MLQPRCLTCRARDEHSTRSCLTTKSCFTFYIIYRLEKNCSLQNCPHGRSGCATNVSPLVLCSFFVIVLTSIKYIPSTNPLLARQRKSRLFTQECSTLWRIYEYFSEAQQHATLERWLEKKGLLLGKGGEARFADDEW